MSRPNETEYDVFISYRRDGGAETAKHLRDVLTERGYRVFFDTDSLRSGDFNRKLFDVIDGCKDFPAHSTDARMRGTGFAWSLPMRSS